MSQNNVTVTLSAKDQITATVRSIKGQINGLQPAIGGIGTGFATAGSAIGSVASKIGLITAGLAAAGVAAAGFMQVGTGLKEAMNVETSILGTANQLASNFKMSMSEGKTQAEEMMLAISKTAADLPGNAKNFADIMGGISGSVAAASGGNFANFKKDALFISEKLGLIAQTSVGGATTAGSSAVGVNKFISSTGGFAELKQLDIFEKNTLLTKNLQEGLKDAGIDLKKFGEAAPELRLKVLKEALAKTASDDYVNMLRKTSSATLGELQDKLFDPQNGVFGFMRKIKVDGATRTGVEAFQKFLAQISILGSEIGAKLGFDPMEGVVRVFDWLTNLTKQAGQMLSKMPNIGSVSDAVNFGINSLNQGLKKVPWGKAGFVVGEQIGKIVANTDWKAVSNFLWSAIDGLLQAIVGAIAGVAKGVASGLQDKLNGLNTTLQQNTGGFFGGSATAGIRSAWGVPDAPASRPLPKFEGNGSANMVDPRASSTINPTININGARMTSQEIASAITTEFTRYQQGQLA